MRVHLTSLIVLVASLVPRVAAAVCASDADCVTEFGEGFTCAESEADLAGQGICYAPCSEGTVACGESTHYCIEEGDICCTREVGNPYGCSPDHQCGEGVTASCEPDQGCQCALFAGGRSASLGALAPWGFVALLLLRRRPPSRARPST